MFVKESVKVFFILRTCVCVFAPISEISLHLLDLKVLEYVQSVVLTGVVLHVFNVVLVYCLITFREHRDLLPRRLSQQWHVEPDPLVRLAVSLPKVNDLL